MRAFLIILLAFVVPLVAADSGVLVPADRTAPDPSVLSLGEMDLDIRIDNGMARIAIRQIFVNHTGGNLEGTYQFALPSGQPVQTLLQRAAIIAEGRFVLLGLNGQSSNQFI